MSSMIKHKAISHLRAFSFLRYKDRSLALTQHLPLAFGFPEKVEVFQCSLHRILKFHYRLEAKVFLCPLTAVVVVSSCQGHPHRRERRLDGEEGTEQPAKQLNHQRNEVHQPIGEVAAGSFVAKTSYHTRDEVPERQGGIVCDEICLQ